MKILCKLVNIAFLMLSGSVVYAQNPFTINGSIDTKQQGTMVLQYNKDGETLKERTPVKDGVFQFKGQTGDPAKAILRFEEEAGNGVPQNKQQQFQRFYLQGGTVTIKGDKGLSEAVIKAAKSQSEFVQLNQQQHPLTIQIEQLRAQMEIARKEVNDTAMSAIQLQGKRLSAKAKNIDSLFIIKHPDSYVAFDLWKDLHRGVIDPEDEAGYLFFSKKIRESREGRQIAEKVEMAKKLDVGKVAPDFTLRDTQNQPVSLSSLKGKNVLLCFWFRSFWGFNVFSFNLSKINRQLKDKNLVILAVSYDTAADWKKALEEQTMNYIHLTDEGGIKIGGSNAQNKAISPVAKSYGLTTMDVLPQGFLIGPDGKITARHLNFKDAGLSSKLEKLLIK